MKDFYNPDQTKKQLTCIMSGCIPCTAQAYCKTHDKPQAIASVPRHCYECGQFIYSDNDTKGMCS
jgi:hypothetical protein